MTLFRLSITLTGLLLALYSATVSAHIRWAEVDTSTCNSSGPCSVEPILVRSNSFINVVYKVVVVHGEPVSIAFSAVGDHNVESTVLKTGLPEISGLNTARIYLPDVECENCSLLVSASHYASEVKIRLTQSGEPIPDPLDLTPPADISALSSLAIDSQIQMMWTNPAEDFAGVLVLQADDWIDDVPADGMMYQRGDAIANAEVVYIGDHSAVTLTALMRNTNYFFKVIAFDDSLNYAPGLQYQVMTTDVGNNPPAITLVAMQNSELTTTIDPSKGEVMIQLAIADADEWDNHQVDWAGTDMRLVDTHGDDLTLSFDPQWLEPGDYPIQVSVMDDGTPVLVATQQMVLTVAAAMPTNTSMPNKSGGGFDALFLVFLSVFFIRGRRRSNVANQRIL